VPSAIPCYLPKPILAAGEPVAAGERSRQVSG
jgi:hypothetical protein